MVEDEKSKSAKSKTAKSKTAKNRREQINEISVLRRLWRAADQQIAESERRMTAQDDAIAEREARTLSIIGKVVRDLVEIGADRKARNAQATARPGKNTKGTRDRGADCNTTDGANWPQDTDQLRADLARHLEHLIAARPAASTAIPA